MLAEWWCGLKSEFYNAVFHSLVNVRFAFSSQKRGNLCRESYCICFCCSSYESLFHKWTFSKNPVLFIFRGKIFSVCENLIFWFFSWKYQAKDENSQLDVISPFLQLHNKRDEDCCSSFSSSTIHKRVIVNHSSELMNRNIFFLVACELVVCMGKFTSNVTCCCLFNFSWYYNKWTSWKLSVWKWKLDYRWAKWNFN